MDQQINFIFLYFLLKLHKSKWADEYSFELVLII